MESVLHRYTCLASALDVLQNRCLTLLDPARWPDANDTAFLQAFKARKQYATVLALCLTQAEETSHHWNAFANGTDGVRIEFNKLDLQRAVDDCPGVTSRKVQYRAVKDVGEYVGDVESLPFTKRRPYRGEEEVRLIYCSTTEIISSFAMPIEAHSIRRITLAPALAEPLVDTVRQVIQSIVGFEQLDVYRSTLLHNQRWIGALEPRSDRP